MHRGTPGHMRLLHRLQGQKVKSQGHGAGAYCGGHLAAQLVNTVNKILFNIFGAMSKDKYSEVSHFGIEPLDEVIGVRSDIFL